MTMQTYEVYIECTEDLRDGSLPLYHVFLDKRYYSCDDIQKMCNDNELNTGRVSQEPD